MPTGAVTGVFGFSREGGKEAGGAPRETVALVLVLVDLFSAMLCCTSAVNSKSSYNKSSP